MKTDVISIYSDLQGQSEAMREAERFAAYFHLTGKDAMHIRLLTEEAISLVHGIIPDYRGDFWLESEKTDKGLLCRICVSANTDVSDGQEEKLLAVATSGKNEEAKGILGKIRQVLRWSIQHTDDEQLLNQSWYQMGNYNAQITPSAAVIYCWSLSRYRSQVADQGGANQSECDELEKSIIAKLSDEVKVGIRSDRSEVIIEKLFTNAG